MDPTRILVRLTQTDGRELLVRADTITLVVPGEGESSMLQVESGGTSAIKEGVKEIERRISRARQELMLEARRG